MQRQWEENQPKAGRRPDVALIKKPEKSVREMETRLLR
jgi:hypothetical protein